MAKKIIGIIPSRYGSTRFPGKPLADIGGKPMIQHVYEQASKAGSLSEVVVATDDERIADAVTQFGGKVVMTSANHQSGTDRCAEVLNNYYADADIIVNIQGDEPFIQPQQIDNLVKCFEDPETQIATLAKEITDFEEIKRSSVVKVVRDIKSFALYFSRSVVPFNQKERQHTYYKHIGIYAYRADVLRTISLLPPSGLELTESLEQLRWLEHGYRIKTAITDFESLAVDTPEDLERVRLKL